MTLRAAHRYECAEIWFLKKKSWKQFLLIWRNFFSLLLFWASICLTFLARRERASRHLRPRDLSRHPAPADLNDLRCRHPTSILCCEFPSFIRANYRSLLGWHRPQWSADPHKNANGATYLERLLCAQLSGFFKFWRHRHRTEIPWEDGDHFEGRLVTVTHARLTANRR